MQMKPAEFIMCERFRASMSPHNEPQIVDHLIRDKSVLYIVECIILSENYGVNLLYNELLDKMFYGTKGIVPDMIIREKQPPEDNILIHTNANEVRMHLSLEHQITFGNKTYEYQIKEG